MALLIRGVEFRFSSSSIVCNSSAHIRQVLDLCLLILHGEGATFNDLSKLVEKLSEGTKNKVLSAEAFSWIFSERLLSEFRSRLAQYFDKVKIILYIRRQDRLVVSHCNQAIKNPKGIAFKFYSPGRDALPYFKPHHLNYLDFDTKVLMLDSVFGKNNVTVRLYEENENFDVVSDFSSLINTKLKSPNIQLNKSLDLEKIKIFHVANSINLSPSFRYMLQKLPNTGNKHLPSETDASNYMEHFIDSNIRLNKRRRLTPNETLFNMDFSTYSCNDLPICERNSNDTQVIYLLRAFNKVFEEHQAKLYHAAEKMRVFDKEESDSIFEFISKLKPIDMFTALSKRT